jgi:D-3-phosphoglycerate dehydrogenase
MHKMPVESRLKSNRAGRRRRQQYSHRKILRKRHRRIQYPRRQRQAVKEITIASLFLSSRKIVQGIEWIGKRLLPKKISDEIAEKGKIRFCGGELEGNTLGVIGLGAIGFAGCQHRPPPWAWKSWATTLHLGGTCVGLSRFVKKAASLKALYEACDYITIHVPLNAGNQRNAPMRIPSRR